MTECSKPVVSIIVPVFNEEDSIEPFLIEIREVANQLKSVRVEVLFVDDGSNDATADKIAFLRDSFQFVRLVRLSRNFGKEAALTAGMEWASGEAAIPMDVDLQDPPQLILQFVEYWQEGFDIVYAKRRARPDDTRAKRGSAGAFYKIFNFIAANRIEENVGDYRLMSRRVVDATLTLRERNRFMKGIFAWVGFDRKEVLYARPERKRGESKFNFWKLWNFALDGITGFSTLPLKIWTYTGVFFALASFIYTFFVVFRTALFGIDTPGYASLISVVLFIGGLQLVSLGLIGEYLGRLYIEVKARPIYLVKDTLGFDGFSASGHEERMYDRKK